MAKPPEHSFTIDDIDRMLKIVGKLPTDHGTLDDAILIEKCRQIKGGDIVYLPTRGKVVQS